MADQTHEHSARPTHARFTTTRWSIVLAAQDSSSRQYTEAIRSLCESYWFPLYAFLRRRGYQREEAEDHTQAFFAHLLEKQGFLPANPNRGRFRSFLLSTFKNFLSDERDRAKALKRGGGRRIFSIDFADAEGQYRLEPAEQLTPERLFEKSWALAVLNNTLVRLAAEWANRNRQDTFDHLKVFLTSEIDAIPYPVLAERLNMTQGAVRVAVHRLRKQYREFLRDEIAQTVAAEDEIDEEIRDLFDALSH